MPSPPPPHVRAAVRIPVQGSRPHRRFDLPPRLEAPPLERQRLQGLPPRLDQVQVSCALRLKHEFPPWIREIEQQHVRTPMRRQVVQHHVHPLERLRHPGFETLQEVGKVPHGPTFVRVRKHLACRGLKRAKHEPCHVPATVVRLLFGALSSRRGWPYQSLASIALDRLWAHLVYADHDAVFGRLSVEPLDGPLFLAKSGSTRSPNHVSS